jgi:hypothetical protein
MELRSLVLRRLSPERVLYLSVLLMSLGSMAAFTVFRGEALFNRYLLFSFIFSMPMAVIPVAPYIENISRNKLCCVIVLALTYTLGSTLWTGRMDTIWVTTVRPQSIIRFTEWLNKSVWRNQPVIFTRMNWQPTYLAYYFPSYGTRNLIISEWLDDDWLKEWTQSAQPSLLVTQRGDEAYVERLFKLTGLAVEPKQPVYRDSDLEVCVLVDTHPNK